MTIIVNIGHNFLGLLGRISLQNSE